MADAVPIGTLPIDTVRITINGNTVSVPAGTSVAAALWNHGVRRFRNSVTGAARAPFCGMGICYECRVTIDGQAGRRSCTLPCRDGMVIETAAAIQAASGKAVTAGSSNA